MAYQIVPFPMTLNDLEMKVLLQSFSNVNSRTLVQQFTRFQLSHASRCPTAIAEILFKVQSLEQHFTGKNPNFGDTQVILQHSVG